MKGDGRIRQQTRDNNQEPSEETRRFESGEADQGGENRSQPWQQCGRIPKPRSQARSQDITIQRKGQRADCSRQAKRSKEGTWGGDETQEEADSTSPSTQAIETRRKILAGKKDELEIHQMNADVIDVLEEANAFTTEDLTGRLEEHVITAKENKIISEQIENQMRGLVDNDEDEEAVDVSQS